MERCYEYLGCKQTDCIMHQTSDTKQCWEVEGTLCSSHAVEYLMEQSGRKEHVCTNCIYYKAVKR